MIELLNCDCMEKLLYSECMAHSEETKRKIGLANRGKLKGRKRSAESIEKGSLSLRKGAYFDCLECGHKLWRAPSAIKKGQNKYCCKACYQKSQVGKPKSEAFKAYCRTRTGKNSPTWKGGKTPEHKRIRNSVETDEWRTLVFERDNYTCQKCFARCGNGVDVHLHAHHIKSFAEYPAHRFEVDNGLTLCKECHYKEHSNG